MEYEAAIKRGIDVLAFLYDGESPWSPAYYELDKDKELKKWRTELMEHKCVGTFTHDPASIEAPVRDAISRWLQRQTRPEVTRPKICAHAFLRDYCRKIQQHRFSGIYLFGHRPRLGAESPTALDNMASTDHGFVPLHLSDWHEPSENKGVEPLEIKDLFFADFKAPRFLVRGLPGSGKTTLLRYLGFRFATLGVEGGEEVIPVFLQLRNFKCSKRSMEKFVFQKIDADSDSPEMRDMLCDESRFLERPMVLLLDGLDEIEDAETSEKIADLLDDFARDHPRCIMIVTSRPIGLKREDYPHISQVRGNSPGQ